jgi:hypothetical protein
MTFLLLSHREEKPVKRGLCCGFMLYVRLTFVFLELRKELIIMGIRGFRIVLLPVLDIRCSPLSYPISTVLYLTDESLYYCLLVGGTIKFGK